MILDRYIRLRDAPGYLGMDCHRFNSDVRPFLTEIPIGNQGIAFDWLDLDAWADEYKSRNGRPGKQRGEKIWDAANTHQGCDYAAVSSISTKGSRKHQAGSFNAALAQLILEKRSGT